MTWERRDKRTFQLTQVQQGERTGNYLTLECSSRESSNAERTLEIVLRRLNGSSRDDIAATLAKLVAAADAAVNELFGLDSRRDIILKHIGPRCAACGNETDSVHTCPCKVALRNDDSLCNCCPACINICRGSI